MCGRGGEGGEGRAVFSNTASFFSDRLSLSVLIKRSQHENGALLCVQVINEKMNELIQLAKDTRQEDDFEALQNRDYSKVS